MDIYLIRHGQSTENRGDAPVIYPPLTDLGREQARCAARALQGIGIDRLYCSPMRRNLLTAAIIGSALRLAPHVLVELCEYGGIWSRVEDGEPVQRTGMSRAQILDECRDAVLPDAVTDRGWWFHHFSGDDDALASFSRRNALAVWQALRRHGESERIAVVGHGRSGSVLISTLFGIPTDRGYARFGEHNCAISHIAITREQTRLVYLNRTDHLSPDMVT